MFKKSFSKLNYGSIRLMSLQKIDGWDWSEMKKKVMEPFDYIKNVPYKHYVLVGPNFNYWLQVPKEKLDHIQQIIRDYVAWSILIDDIRDDSPFRHGVPTANRVFGVAAAINAASSSLFQIQKQVIDLGHPLAITKFIERTEEALEGEGIDVYWRDRVIIPTEEAHIEMTKKKGGGYFAVPVELLQLFSSNKTDYTDVAVNIGSYFEILDDYYNLFDRKALPRLAKKRQENHMVNSDITEGKITLAMIHALQFPDVATELIEILKQRTSDPKLQNRFTSLLKKHGSDVYMRNHLNELEADIRTKIAKLGGNPMLSAYMDDLSLLSHEPAPGQELYS